MNLEMVTAAIRAAEEERSPVVIRVHPDVRRISRLRTISAVVHHLAGEATVPVALSLDHGASLEDVADAIAAGFTGVMMDAAELPLQENISLVERIVAFARPIGVVVEASLGHMPHGATQRSEDMASPSDARTLMERTGADILAPAVGNVHGTAHGEAKATPQLDIARIRELHTGASVPLCLHGGSSIPEDQMRSAIDAGVRMVIIYTNVVGAFDREVRRVLGQEDESIDILAALEPGQQAATRVIREKIRSFRSDGRVRDLLGARAVS